MGSLLDAMSLACPEVELGSLLDAMSFADPEAEETFTSDFLDVSKAMSFGNGFLNVTPVFFSSRSALESRDEPWPRLTGLTGKSGGFGGPVPLPP